MKLFYVLLFTVVLCSLLVRAMQTHGITQHIYEVGFWIMAIVLEATESICRHIDTLHVKEST